jgi:hypothetical protein
MFRDLNMNRSLQLQSRMKYPLLALALLLVILSGCGRADGFRTLFHEESLPSGHAVKVTMLALVWGGRPGDDGCTMGSDCFHLEFVSNDPNAEVPNRTAEAQQVFELIRPSSEQWGLTNAEVLGFKQLERTGDYDLFAFTRASDGKWSCAQKTMSVFAK